METLKNPEVEADFVPQSEKERTISEIKKEIRDLVTYCERLEIQKALNLFHNGPDFVMIGLDGSKMNYKTFYQSELDTFSACSDFKMKLIAEDFRFLTRHYVLYEMVYQANLTFKSGHQEHFTKVTTTFLFKNINGSWQVVFIHESGPPVKKILRYPKA